jgi:hypothetical protein
MMDSLKNWNNYWIENSNLKNLDPGQEISKDVPRIQTKEITG